MSTEIDSPRDDSILSPFEGAEELQLPERGGGSSARFWGVIALLALAGGAASYFAISYLRDPYRTLEPFPVAKYLDNYKSLAGGRFKGQVRVEADLGWKEGAGRLMLFSFLEEPRPIAVLVPASLAKDIYFVKGQTYLAELEVKEGGLIYANACRKN